MECLTFVGWRKCFGSLPAASVPPWDHSSGSRLVLQEQAEPQCLSPMVLLGLFPWSLIQVNSLLFARMVLITKNECILQQEAE